MEEMNFLNDESALRAAAEHGTPVFVYDQATLEEAAARALGFPNAFGLTVRYAMKALPAAAVLRVFNDAGLHIDASSGYEAERALRAGIEPDRIQLTTQELPKNLKDIVARGVRFNACSMNQLRAYGELFPGTEVCVRINPGMGSGHNKRTNVGGPSSSFGIWHEYVDEVLSTATDRNLTITRMHTHIGSGSEPELWTRCAHMSLEIAAKIPDVQRLSLGGGFKIGRMPREVSADLHEIGLSIKKAFEDFHAQHGRKLHLEIEPGTYLVGNAGAVIATVIDVVDTGPGGFRFIKVDSGMTEVLRPSHYGAQQPITLVKTYGAASAESFDYVIAGHCCESGDILTPADGDPEELKPRSLPQADVGDLIVIGGAGAYCASMSSKNYNSFPEAAEVLITNNGEPKLIRSRQSLDQLLENELE